MRHCRIDADSRPARQALPALDRDVDVAGINLDQASSAPGLLGSDQSCASAPEWIEDDIIAVGAISDGVSNKRDRFDCRMQPKACS